MNKIWKIYLDDIRIPKGYEWLVIRNYFEFTTCIKNHGLPSFISFDHDLGEDVARLRVKSGISKRKARAEKRLSKSGMDCAKWLVKYCLDNDLELPEFDCH